MSKIVVLAEIEVAASDLQKLSDNRKQIIESVALDLGSAFEWYGRTKRMAITRDVTFGDTESANIRSAVSRVLAGLLDGLPVAEQVAWIVALLAKLDPRPSETELCDQLLDAVEYTYNNGEWRYDKAI